MSVLEHDLHTLYSDHHGWLHGWLRKKLGCAHHDHAADLAHDTFVRVLSMRQVAFGVREPRAFLRTIAHGLVVNHWRRQEIERAYLEVLAQAPESCAPSPEERQMVIEVLESIAAMLDGLPSRAREILLLSQLDGLTYPQIAERLKVTVNVVQKTMIKVLARCYAVTYD